MSDAKTPSPKDREASQFRNASAVTLVFGTVFLLPVCVATLFGGRASSQGALIREIESSGRVRTEPVLPGWLRRWIGEERCQGWDRIEVIHWPDATDDSLSRLAQCTSLQELYLDSARVTDEGLTQLNELPDLVVLSLKETHVTDEGLKQLERHNSLQFLFLESTNVTDEGVTDLQRKLPNCTISK